ncbi:glycosyltransferase family 1 protein [Nostoc sp. CENA67]|uniref:Glycosyltransferase family 1 protein n=1 Tax=Amazonocrinis nigriterrae CENA67 TaxID=2794033 RepID=A0A8J7HN11_9NOST|nr:glycosyltransferase family 1 protein [Amazonocrinis nigriterrae]MBH8562372.1 glycosyltransferase family 1 protein [Amazonocrinis nigriterrae CENA67]MBH8562407.1 glycosyltransferase family 1 protein [Amazonocrinis nigriterrae CENA67]
MTLGDKSSIRILHVVGGMNRGGIETWLMHILRHIDRDRFHMDFLVHTTQPCAYDEEIRALGSKVIPCLHPSRPWFYANNFKRILDEYGSYDIVHSHVHHFSGYVLRLARQAGVPICIAHSHNDTSLKEAVAGLYRQLYLILMKRWITQYATLGLAASRKAAVNLFGSSWQTDKRWQTFCCSMDLLPFHNQTDRQAVRAELGIPPEAFVIGHVGRFEQQKNHQFLLDIVAEIAKQETKMHLLLIGDGLLRPDIEQKVIQMGLADRVIFTGLRPDVPRLMLGAMDIFLFPSLHEGLGLALIEAQAAGLVCVFSDVVPDEADVVKPLMQRMSLSESASTWAKTVLAAKASAATISQANALLAVEKSPFNIEVGVRKLEKIYQTSLSKQ